MLPKNTMWHLFQSSFIYKMENRVLIFDYPFEESKRKSNQSLSDGFIDPEILRNENVYIFASHSHYDHYNSDVLKWINFNKNIKYIFSSDIEENGNNIFKVNENEVLNIDDIKIKTYPSTDIGVAFSIYTEGKHIYFAGDNAFWNWENKNNTETDYINKTLHKIDTSTHLDIAFQVCDPRLEGRGEGGIYILAKILSPKILIPIHAFNKYSINKKAHAKLLELGFENRFWPISARGECLSL